VTLDEEIQLRLWRRRIGSLGVGERVSFSGTTVLRADRNRYDIERGGTVMVVGGGSASAFTAAQMALARVVGQGCERLCPRCGTRHPQPGKALCDVCIREDTHRERMQKKWLQNGR